MAAEKAAREKLHAAAEEAAKAQAAQQAEAAERQKAAVEACKHAVEASWHAKLSQAESVERELRGELKENEVPWEPPRLQPQPRHPNPGDPIGRAAGAPSLVAGRGR